MNKLLLFFTLISFQISAQTWVEDNAVWHYDFWNIGAQVGFYKIERNGDSILNGQLCERYDVRTTKFWYYTQPPGSGLNDTVIYIGEYLIDVQFVYKSNDSIYRWENNDFMLLFDFGAQIGDQWAVSTLESPWVSGCNDTSVVEVVDTGSVLINGNTYRTITLNTPMESPWYLFGTFNERFGGDYIFPRIGEYPCSQGVLEADILSFKCFEDDSLPLYNPSGEDCEYYLTHLDLDEFKLNRVELYPNPTNGELNINNLLVTRAVVYTMDGKLAEELNFEKAVEKFSLSTLQPGLYYLYLYSDDGRVFPERIILK